MSLRRNLDMSGSYQNIRTPISLPAVKYSFATNVTLQDAHIRWQHLVQDRLELVFDSVRYSNSNSSLDQRKCMKVLQGTELLVIPLISSILCI